MINRYHKTDSAKSSTPLETQARQALNPARCSTPPGAQPRQVLGGFEIRR